MFFIVLCICLLVLCIVEIVAFFLFFKRQKETMDDLCAIAHDLGTACGIVQQAAHLSASKENEAYIHMLSQQSAYIVLLCRVICSMGAMRLWQRQVLVRRRLGDAARCIHEACMQLSTWLHHQKIDLEFETLGTCTARFDALALQRILYNLVTNAAEAMEQGGRICVRVDGESDPNAVFVVVQDDGCGMDASRLAEIFHTHATNKSDRAIHGLGLPCALRLAKLHGGNLSVESNPGRGTCFTLQLPR